MQKYLDQYDYKIIVRLLQDGRSTFSTIAKDLGITDVAVKKRFERLISKGIIRKVSVDLDYVQLGIGAEVMIFLKVDPVIEDKAMLLLKEEDLVRTIYKTVGDYNITFFYMVRDFSQLSSIEKVLSKIKGIIDYKMLFVTEKSFDKQNIPLSSLQVYYR